MKQTHFPLNRAESTIFAKTVSIVFGLACIGIAIFWLFFNINSLKENGALWITILFILGFGIYILLSGLGLANSYILIDSDYIILKQHKLLSSIKIMANEIEKIESLPLNVIIYRKEKKRVLLRFGTTWHETNSNIIDEIIGFAQTNNIPFEIIEEEL